METRSTLIFSFCISATGKVKPLLKSLDPNLLRGHLDFDFFQKIWLFFRVQKKRKSFLAPCRPNPLFFKMSQDFVYSDSCTWVHEFEEKTKFHVQGYMNLRKQNLGTFWKKEGGMAPKKISVLFRFLSTLKNNQIFWKISKSR